MPKNSIPEKMRIDCGKVTDLCSMVTVLKLGRLLLTGTCFSLLSYGNREDVYRMTTRPHDTEWPYIIKWVAELCGTLVQSIPKSCPGAITVGFGVEWNRAGWPWVATLGLGQPKPRLYSLSKIIFSEDMPVSI